MNREIPRKEDDKLTSSHASDGWDTIEGVPSWGIAIIQQNMKDREGKGIHSCVVRELFKPKGF